MPPPQISILVPAYGEAATIETVVRRVTGLGLDAEIIVVDDGSQDATSQIVTRLADELPGVQLIRHEHNQGKGAAVRTAIAASTGSIVLIQDADLEYDPADIPKLLAPLLAGVADVVYGTRLRGGEPQRAHLFWHYAGNRFLSLLTNVLFNTTISDMEVGYKAFDGDLVRSLKIVSHDFAFEPEITARVLLTPGIRLYEVPISYYGRTYAEGKKIVFMDGVIALWLVIRFNLFCSLRASFRELPELKKK